MSEAGGAAGRVRCANRSDEIPMRVATTIVDATNLRFTNLNLSGEIFRTFCDALEALAGWPFGTQASGLLLFLSWPEAGGPSIPLHQDSHSPRPRGREAWR